MKVVTQGFKDAVRTFGRELDTIITIGEETYDKELLNGIVPSFSVGLFKTIMKGVEIDSNIFIPKNSSLNVKSGVLVNGAYEYIDYGNYKTIDDSQIDEDTSSYKVMAYDKIVESMIDFNLGINYPISIRDFWLAIYNELGWDIVGIPETFVNSTKMINQDVYSGIGYTYRDVLDELCTISGVWLVDKNGIPTIVSPTETNENIDETYLSDINVTIKQEVFFNSLVFSRAEESDNIFRKDDDSILVNGLKEFRISDNQLLSTNDRVDYIDELWEYLKTFRYYAFEVDTIGVMFLEPLDKFNLVAHEHTYPTILLNDETQITQGLKEVLYSDLPEESQTDYKYADTTDRKVNQAYILVNKQEQTITQLVSKTESISNDLENNYTTNTDLENVIKQTVEETTNLISQTGGFNLLLNSQFYQDLEEWTKTDGSIYQVITGTSDVEQNTSCKSELEWTSGTLSQTYSTTIGKEYTISFKYKKQGQLDKTSYVRIYRDDDTYISVLEASGQQEDRKEVSLTYVASVNNPKLVIFSDNDDFYITDLIVQVGTSTEWSPNANETRGLGHTLTGSNLNIYDVSNSGNNVLITPSNITFYLDNQLSSNYGASDMSVNQATIKTRMISCGITRKYLGDDDAIES